MKLVHVIIGLHVGGAELMLLKLLQGLDRSRFDSVVIALTEGGEVSARIAELGVPVHHLGLGSVWHLPVVLRRLHGLARDLAPDAVQGWMYHGNIAASLLARWSPHRPDLIWNIRHTLVDPSLEKPLTRAVIRLGGRWSSGASKVIHNARQSVAQHEDQGFAHGNAVVIPNGFDLDRFRPDATAGPALRAELGLPPESLLVGTLGRWHPLKGQAVFFQALGAVPPTPAPVHYLCAGRGLTADNADVAQLVAATGAADRVHLLGQRDEPQRFLAGLDVFCLPSRGEGFPNALGEAMACGVPCVATAAGEATLMLEGLQDTVPVDSPSDLAAALARMLATAAGQRRELGARGRDRIAERYGLAAITARYAELYTAGQAARKRDR